MTLTRKFGGKNHKDQYIMKKTTLNVIKLCMTILVGLSLGSCTKTNYPGGEISPYIAIYDVRTLYKGSPVELTVDALDGSSKLTGIVISDHSANNLPEGLLIIQDRSRLKLLRGLAINLGEQAHDYVPGDSVVIDIVGARLNRVGDALQLDNVNPSQVERTGAGVEIPVNSVTVDQIVARPGDYESTLLSIVKGGFTEMPGAGQYLGAEENINDGFGLMKLRIDEKSSLKSIPKYRMANYSGIIFNELQGDSLVPIQKIRTANDVVELTSVYTTPKIIITGWIADPKGTDANNEYIQLMATEDIDFAKTPFSLVTTNNANASTPTGYPQKGWATGDKRTYKFNLTTGKAPKGTFFYVGGSRKLINSTGSTSIAHANWITAYPYNTEPGVDFGAPTTNLLANSGNAYGIAVFQGATVDVNSVPEDVMFVATGGSLFGGGFGYRIANTDYYDIIDPISFAEQPFYRSGGNMKSLTYTTPSDQGYFYQLGGEFNLTLGRWTTARTQTNFQLSKESVLEEIENEFSTKLVN